MPDDVNTNNSSNGNGQHNGSVLARLGAKASRYRAQVKTLTDKVSELETANASLTKQVTELSANTDSKKLQERVAQLQGALRERDHKQVFDKTARSLGSLDSALDDLWSLSGYRPETDIPDEDAITELIKEQKEKRAYLFAEAPATDKKKPVESKPGPGSGKGGTSTTGIPVVNEELARNDPAYIMKNQARIVEAAKHKVSLREAQ